MMYAGDEWLAADDAAFGPFYECGDYAEQCLECGALPGVPCDCC